MATFVLAIFLYSLSLTRVVHADDDHGANAVSYDSDKFLTGLKNSRSFVMFYAPWCGHCKNLAPTWDELAKIYNRGEESPVVIAKVDCTVHTELCADQEIVGFPTLKLFSVGGDNHKRYSGKRDIESLKAFIQENMNEEAFDAEDVRNKPEVPAPKGSPVILTDDNFEDLAGKGFSFVKFYAPWCGHCQKLAPTWDDLGNIFSNQDKVRIAKIDCTKSSVICKHYDIGGYPTLMWLKDGVKTDQYQGPRTLEVLKKYVSDRLITETKESQKQEDAKEPEKHQEPASSKSFVKELADENFKSQISSGLHFVKFYAPWCGHCKRLAPTWEDLAKEFHDVPVSISSIDCTQYKTTCDENQIRGYPTLKLFHNGEFVKDYRGARTLEDLNAFVKKNLDGASHDEL